MAKNPSRALEITIISGEGLSINHKRPVKKNAFVIIRTDTHNYRTTKIDTDGGSCPSWNEKLALDLPMHAKFITVEVQCKTSSGNDRFVGAARIPVSDFAGGYMPDSYLHFLSYRLRKANGERNGIINLSVKVKVPEFVGPTSTRPCMGTPVGMAPMGNPVVQKNYGGVVTGIPVWYGHPV